MDEVNQLIVPDVRDENLPVGWAETKGLPVLQNATWDELDEYEAKLLGVASYIESLGGDATELEKALRIVEWRRGVLLGEPKPGQRRDLEPVPCVGQVDIPKQTASRYRKIAKHWDNVAWPHIRTADHVSRVRQTAVLRIIDEYLRDAERKYDKQAIELLGDPQQQLEQLRQNPVPTIVLDPPWDWGDEGDVSQFGRGRPLFATMPLADIAQLPIPDIAEPNAHVYLWITNRSLPKGFVLLDTWGFRYITCLTWVKPSFGMGNYFRGSTEHVLFGVRGSLPLRRKDAPTHFTSEKKRRRHSEKPDEFYSLVETCSPGPRVEMFARRERDEWIPWPKRGDDNKSE